MLEVRNKDNVIFLFAPYWENVAECVGVYAVFRRGIQKCVL